ncbi:BrnT family toxin [Candidatus Magnetaquicoccus inordinatus]|uniref:BrnT family toxin n=1 Tax=Candidatus Magnetaquicoccus inordinatus TaxID=2496818 RepID=UPI00102B0BC9|nr:BrnT family toxin [Candidatus Magnetaquicoccus inordinatus]
MNITFDPDKSMKNIRERGISFDDAVRFDFKTALFSVDDRHDYGEKRYVAIGYLDHRLHVLCFVETVNGIRVISFRKANAREVKRYGKPKTIDG